jgi:hypothetical protein
VRRFLAIVGCVVVAVVAVALITLWIVGLDPHERRPGLWLRGEPMATPVTDWAFTDSYPTIYIQTRSWYLLPHSVTITCVAHGGHLYLTSVFRQGSEFPEGKRWTSDVMRDPRVRLKFGNQVLDATVSLVTDPAERTAALEAKARKYPGQRVPETSTVYLFRVQPG